MTDTLANPVTVTEPDPVHYTVRRRVSETIEIQIGCDQVTFTVDVAEDRQHYGLAISGSYGGYTYVWSSIGSSFAKFLADLDVSYAGGKMVGRDEVFDGERTARAIRVAILDERRCGNFDRETARNEWDEVPDEFDHEVDYHRWTEHTGFDDPHYFWCTKGGSRSQDFTHMFQRFWPAFVAELLHPTEDAVHS